MQKWTNGKLCILFSIKEYQYMPINNLCIKNRIALRLSFIPFNSFDTSVKLKILTLIKCNDNMWLEFFFFLIKIRQILSVG